MDKSAVLGRLQLAGLWSKKSLGQHFLIDDAVLDCMVESANLTAGEEVLEIGPGLGVLTRALLTKKVRLTTFEADPHMAHILHSDLPGVSVVQGDAIATLPKEITERSRYKVVANIPYQITTPLLKVLLEDSTIPRPTSVTLLVQREVAERLTAAPGKSERGYLTVLIEYYCRAEIKRRVGPESFFPEPKVDSAVLHLALYKPEDRIKIDNLEQFLHFVRRAFMQPRKQLKNIIAGMRGVSTSEIEKELQKLSINTNIRAHQLSLVEWRNLYNQLYA